MQRSASRDATTTDIADTCLASRGRDDSSCSGTISTTNAWKDTPDGQPELRWNVAANASRTSLCALLQSCWVHSGVCTQGQLCGGPSGSTAFDTLCLAASGALAGAGPGVAHRAAGAGRAGGGRHGALRAARGDAGGVAAAKGGAAAGRQQQAPGQEGEEFMVP